MFKYRHRSYATLRYSGQEVLPNDTWHNSLAITCSLHPDFICRDPQSYNAYKYSSWV